uniref:Uncharacterized protein n=1 Tax=Anopheles albimanus TaxID=7167 RepID=A0A182FX61_ANOAL
MDSITSQSPTRGKRRSKDLYRVP